MTFADEFFAARRAEARLESEAMKALLRIVGIDIEGDSRWPFTDFAFDDYDGSFELLECDDALRLNEAQRAQAWELGFDRCWLNHKDGSETYYWKDGGESRKERGPRAEPARSDSEPAPQQPPPSPTGDAE